MQSRCVSLTTQAPSSIAARCGWLLRFFYQMHVEPSAVPQPRCAGKLLDAVVLELQIGTLESGEIDYDELRDELAANSARPAILNVNIGTTVRGAVDDLDRVLQILTVRLCVIPPIGLSRGAASGKAFSQPGQCHVDNDVQSLFMTSA